MTTALDAVAINRPALLGLRSAQASLNEQCRSPRRYV